MQSNLKQYFAVKVADLVKNTAELREYMINDMSLPEDVTDAILDGSLGIGVVS